MRLSSSVERSSISLSQIGLTEPRRIFFAPVHQIERIRFRTGDLRTFPTIDPPADWMPRNLINRIEVLTPVYDEDMQADLLRTISYGMRAVSYTHLIDDLSTLEDNRIYLAVEKAEDDKKKKYAVVRYQIEFTDAG